MKIKLKFTWWPSQSRNQSRNCRLFKSEEPRLRFGSKQLISCCVIIFVLIQLVSACAESECVCGLTGKKEISLLQG